jgi:hypothetical protein
MPAETTRAVEHPTEASHWQSAFRELVHGFLVLRDLFSYSLPGAAFLAIGLRSTLPGVKQLVAEIKGTPAWAVMLLGLFASYLAGHFLLAAYYLLPNVGQALQLRHLWARLSRRDAKELTHPLSTRELIYRRQFPELFVELDRHRIIVDMRRGLALALVLGVIVFHWWPNGWSTDWIERLVVTAGVVLWISALSGDLRGRKVRADTMQAALEVAEGISADVESLAGREAVNASPAPRP